MLYHRAVAEPDSVRHYLEVVAGEARGPLRARSRLDLARFHREQGASEAALATLQRLVTVDPASRYVPAAIELEGRVHEDLGNPSAAMAAYESLLLDHEGYVYLDRVRDRIRALRQAGVASVTEEEELP